MMFACLCSSWMHSKGKPITNRRIKANVETAGNLLSLASHTMSFHKNSDGQYTFLDLAYAQYVRGTFDFTRNLTFDYNNQLVFHVGLGVAYPYGNSSILPFEKRY